MTFRIAAEPPAMNGERILDFLGKPFEGEYVAGAAELLKNSVDHAVRTKEPGEPVIHFEIRTPRGMPPATWSMTCTDFMGTTFTEINDHLKEWGSEVAASRGDANFAGFGGHGNGGKFTLRENFVTSEFITYRGGCLTVFGFDSNKRYGFDRDYQGKPVAPTQALRIAGIDPDNPDFPAEIRERLASNDPLQCRFTVVRGRGFRHARRWRKRTTFWEHLRSHPQAKQVLTRARVIFRDDLKKIDPLLPPEIPSRPGYEHGREYPVPPKLRFDGDDYDFAQGEGHPGTLTLNVAAEPFQRTSSMHTIDMKGRNGITIASYKITELRIRNVVGADFIWGVLDCPALDDHGLRTNERTHLVPNDITHALLEWIGTRVDELSDELEKEENQRRHDQDSRATVALTNRLNAWKNRFLTARQISVSVGPSFGEGDGGIGGGSDGPGMGPAGGKGGDEGPPRPRDGQGNGKPGGPGEEDGGGAGPNERKSPRYPEIRVSGHDADPFGSEPFNLNPRHPVVYQRAEDVPANLWWINAQRPLPQRIINEDSAKSARFSDYIFSRFVEVIQTYELGRWDRTSDLPSFLWELTGQIHDSAAVDLADVLFARSDEEESDELGEDTPDDAD